MRITDDRGLEGMPLKLVIISIMISICAPFLSSALRSYEEESGSILLQDAMEKICDTVEEVYLSGPGNSRSLNIHIPQDPSRYVIIGGPNGTEGNSVAIIDQGLELERVYLNEPTIRLLTPGAYGLVLEHDTIITITCVELSGERWVEVTT
jgi:hypothetical protein